MPLKNFDIPQQFAKIVIFLQPLSQDYNRASHATHVRFVNFFHFFTSILYNIFQILISKSRMRKICVRRYEGYNSQLWYDGNWFLAWKMFLLWFPLSRFLAKTLRVNKMKSFSKICRLESTLNCRSRHLMYKINTHNISDVRN